MDEMRELIDTLYMHFGKFDYPMFNDKQVADMLTELLDKIEMYQTLCDKTSDALMRSIKLLEKLDKQLNIFEELCEPKESNR